MNVISAQRTRVIVGVLLAILLGLLITLRVTATALPDSASFGDVLAAPTFAKTLAVNLLVGLSVLLFVYETRWGAFRALITVIAALAIGFLILLVINTDPWNAFANLLSGPLSQLNRWGNWINDAISLTLLGLAIALVFSAQLFSLGAEGQIYFGALATGWVAL